MDLRKVRNEDKLNLCRWYYKGGFFALPFLWFVNAIWFFNEAFRKPHFEEQALIKTCNSIVYEEPHVIRSATGAAIWASILIAWVTVFQLNRAEWGKIADDISFIIPTGIP